MSHNITCGILIRVSIGSSSRYLVSNKWWSELMFELETSDELSFNASCDQVGSTSLDPLIRQYLTIAFHSG